MHSHAIETTGLSKVYPSHTLRRRVPLRWRGKTPLASPVCALEPLTLTVPTGEVFGFLGPNGAGKSTLIRLLLGFLHPTTGTAKVLGLDSVRESVRIRQRTGYLPGGISLYDGLTGLEHLEYFAALSGGGASERAVLCDRLELPRATLGRRVREYSRGMRQKIGIVQALQHGPEVAILDEPTEGLDPLMQRAFYEIIDDLKARGHSVFFSSHVLSEVQRVCDRVAIIRQGRLVALERIQELIGRRQRKVDIWHEGSLHGLDEVDGVSHLVAAEGRLTCMVAGDVGPLLRELASAHILDLTIEPASLEDAFLEFYQGDRAS